jgi:hypothetical protein
MKSQSGCFSWENLPKPDPNWKDTFPLSLKTFNDENLKEKQKCLTQEEMKTLVGEALL